MALSECVFCFFFFFFNDTATTEIYTLPYTTLFRSVHTWTDEQVALKVLDSQYAGHPEIVERLLAEHALASRTCHPGVLDIRGAFWTDDRVPYLVMEYLSGETLGAIADRAPIDLPSIIASCAPA